MGENGGQRIDKWLFFARVAKSRSLAQKIVASGAVRVNREKIANVARLVRPGDVLTLSLHGRVRVLKVVDGGSRRGPASEAATLFEDLAPPPPRDGPETIEGEPALDAAGDLADTEDVDGGK
ncbi:RNA-binding S4 domain-containing protein [Antarcticirhabdus aurantiaca]|uniref:RNA-binding S4 domain-containing protein n=1 Tax=Antarcticirhabdus aurantiaca TaxID=2606717 RepID=UPI0034E1F278